MSEEIYMDVPQVRELANRFGQMGESLDKLSKTLEAAIAMLKASAFVSMFSTYAMATYLETVQPVIEKFASICAEMKSDLGASIDAYVRGDAAGAAKFH